MRILVIGGTGVISRAIIREGMKAGHEMIVVNRGQREVFFERKPEMIIADRKDPEAFAQKMRDVDVDAVIDMISYNAADARQTIETFAGKTKQYLFTSSSAVYQRPYLSYPIREDAPVLTENSFPYGFQKAEMERYLRTQMGGGAPITIIRPSLTFGEGCANIGVLRQNANIMHRMLAEKPLVLFGDGTTVMTFTFAPDLARGYLGCVGCPAAYNETFHITSNNTADFEQLYRTIGKIVGAGPDFVYIPSKILYHADADLFGHIWLEKRFCHIFSNEKIHAATGFEPQISLEEGLRGIVDWWKSSGQGIDINKDLLEDRLCGLES